MKKKHTQFGTSAKPGIAAVRPISRSAAIASTKAGQDIAIEVIKKFDEWLSAQGKTVGKPSN
jgi:hypothetical protein